MDKPNPGSSIHTLVFKNNHWLLVCNDLKKGRYRLTVFLSEDEGMSWPWRREPIRPLFREKMGHCMGSIPMLRRYLPKSATNASATSILMKNGLKWEKCRAMDRIKGGKKALSPRCHSAVIFFCVVILSTRRKFPSE
jgi:hypothetical protein